MKKAITILAVLIVLVSAVFADAPAGETQKITIQSTVARKDPQFLLKGVAGADQSGFTTEAAKTTTEYEGTELDSGVDISQEAVVASFALYQTAAAKNRFAYTFTISATKLVQREDAEHREPAQPYTTANAPVFSELDDDNWYAPAGEGQANNGITSGTASLKLTEGVATGVSADVTFNGKATVAASNTPKLAFTVTWADDKAAPAGLYEADVTMTYTVV